MTPPLFAMNDSNSMSVGVEFDVVGPDGLKPGKSEIQSSFDWIDVREIPAHDSAEVFVSFVDPESESLAALASVMLRRAGLRPYLAREESHPGCDYWAEKICPAIARSAGPFVIWTSDNGRRPAAVLREIAHAERMKIPIGLFLENGVEPPQSFPAQKREYLAFDRHAPHEAFAQAIAAGRRRWVMTRRFF